jgi:hypothetical protein
MNVGQELVRRLKRFTDNMESKMNTRYEPIYVSNLDHGFPATKIDWDKKEEPTFKPVAYMVEDIKGIAAIFPNEHDAYDFANEKHRNKVDCSVVPLYRSLPTAIKFLPPTPAPSESYVGAGWFKLEEDDILQEGDECDIGLGTWMSTTYVGDRVGNFGEAYRRRVTPDEKPLGAFLDEENNELRQQVATLKAEVERLRLTDQEMKAVKYFANSNWTTYHPLATVLDSLLRRWGIII